MNRNLALTKAPVVFFTKHSPARSVEELARQASAIGCEGYDLCCRAGHPVHPGNVRAALPEAARQLREAGLVVPMLTGEGGLLEPTDPTAEPILAAMQESQVGLLKLGYFSIHNAKEDYWEKVGYIRRQLDGWARLGEKFGVRVCYHTHSDPSMMGLNAAAVMHLVHDFDPRWIGVYLDPGHLLIDGEHLDIAFNMVKRHLAIIGLKDARKDRNPVGPGYRQTLCRAGFGDVDWGNLVANLRRVDFTGPLSVHAEYERSYPPGRGTEALFPASLAEEFRFFRRLRDEFLRMPEA
jgi:sugar phosphate isomerase/epimerase